MQERKAALIYLIFVLLSCPQFAFAQTQSNQNSVFFATQAIANSQLQDQQKNGKIDAALVDQLIANKVSEQDGDCKAESVFSKTPETKKEKKEDNFEIVAVVEVASPVKEQLINDMNPNYDLSWYNIGQKYGNKYLCLENYVDLVSSSSLKYNQFDSNLAAVKSSFYSNTSSGAPLQLNGKPAEYINVFTDDGSMAPMLLPKAEMDAGAKDGFFVALLNATVAQKFQSGQTPSAEDDQTATQEVASIIASHYSSDADRMRI